MTNPEDVPADVTLPAADERPAADQQPAEVVGQAPAPPAAEPSTKKQGLTVTKGELLPWKGVWWKVVDIVKAVTPDGEGSMDCLVILPKEQTNGSLKRGIARQKWIARHPRANEHEKPQGGRRVAR